MKVNICCQHLTLVNKICKINRLQKISIHLIFNAKPIVHTAPLFKMAGIIPAEHTFKNEAIKLAYKCINESPKLIQPIAIKEMLLKRTNTRNAPRLNEPMANNQTIEPSNH